MKCISLACLRNSKCPQQFIALRCALRSVQLHYGFSRSLRGISDSFRRRCDNTAVALHRYIFCKPLCDGVRVSFSLFIFSTAPGDSRCSLSFLFAPCLFVSPFARSTASHFFDFSTPTFSFFFETTWLRSVLHPLSSSFRLSQRFVQQMTGTCLAVASVTTMSLQAPSLSLRPSKWYVTCFIMQSSL
jgi:hypothetical protein